MTLNVHINILFFLRYICRHMYRSDRKLLPDARFQQLSVISPSNVFLDFLTLVINTTVYSCNWLFSTQTVSPLVEDEWRVSHYVKMAGRVWIRTKNKLYWQPASLPPELPWLCGSYLTILFCLILPWSAKTTSLTTVRFTSFSSIIVRFLVAYYESAADDWQKHGQSL